MHVRRAHSGVQRRVLPLVVYYGTGRPGSKKKAKAQRKIQHPLAKTDSLTPHLAYQRCVEWFWYWNLKRDNRQLKDDNPTAFLAEGATIERNP